MTARRRSQLGFALGLPFAVGIAGLVLPSLAAPAGEGASVALTAPKTTAGFKPLDYFQNNCARCHGDYGTAYGSEFAKNITDEQLQTFVRDMAEGPAQAPLGDADLASETDFHRALRDGRPFGAAVTWKDGVLSGEATPGSLITLEIEGQTQNIPLKGNSWSVKVPSPLSWKTAKLRLSRVGKETVIPLAERAF